MTDNTLELPVTKSMARVLEDQGKFDEALEIYRTLMRSSSDRGLAAAVSRIEEKKAGTFGKHLVNPAAQMNALNSMLVRISERRRPPGARGRDSLGSRPEDALKRAGEKNARRYEFLSNLILRIRKNSRII